MSEAETTTFRDVFDLPMSYPEALYDELRKRASERGWNILWPKQVIDLPETGETIAISGVTWGRPDLEALDELASRKTGETIVWLFCLDYWEPGEKGLPGIPQITATPVLAEYSGRHLKAFAQGRGFQSHHGTVSAPCLIPLSEVSAIFGTSDLQQSLQQAQRTARPCAAGPVSLSSL